MINHSDILQLCRLCLVEEKVNHPIFEEAGDLRSIFLKITSCLPISIREDDSLPKNICDSCSSKLDSFYQFWNETANAEKQLLQWLKESALTPLSQTVQTETIKNKMDTTEVKEEIDVIENKVDAVEMSSEAQTYILQQQQLPYSSTPPKILPTLNETDEPAPKRPKRASAMKAMEQMESEDDDDEDFGAENYTKSESENSDKEDGTYPEGPSTSMDDQPGPSGMGKGSTDAPSPIVLKQWEVKLVDVKSMLGPNGTYVVPRRRKWLTCYHCFERFDSTDLLELHKLSHKEESDEEQKSDKEAFVDDGPSDSTEEEESDYESDVSDRSVGLARKRIVSGKPAVKINTTISQIATTKSLNNTNTGDSQSSTRKRKLPSIHESPVDQANVPPATTSTIPRSKEDDNLLERINKLPVLNNINIKCITCNAVFTNSDQLKVHSAVDPTNSCSFVCKVCSDNFTSSLHFLEHLIQHNTFIPRKSGHSIITDTKRRYYCVICDTHFEHYHQLTRHKDSMHSDKENRSKTADQQNPVRKTGLITVRKPSELNSLAIGTVIGSPKSNESVGPSTATEINGEPSVNTAPSSPKVLTCEICYDTFSDKESFKEHMDFHRNNGADENYLCGVCNKQFITISCLKKHQRLKNH